MTQSPERDSYDGVSANLPSRREFIRTSAALGLLPLASLAQAAPTDARKLKIVCVGAHPDDPESGCGGTLRKLSVAGHQVTALYLTRGEAGIAGKSHDAAARIRTGEAAHACRTLAIEPAFFGQIDGATIFSAAEVGRMQQMLAGLVPDLVLTHWPLDTHPDHQVASALTLQARVRSPRPFDLYFYEVCIGSQSLGFRPTDYVDITDVQALKRAAVDCHASQNPAEIYGEGRHALMEQFRGAECGVVAAEAFVRLPSAQPAVLAR